jgi:hypothetical protein
MKSVLLFVFVCFIISTAYSQERSFNFYGNTIELKNLSAEDCDSMIKENKVPASLQLYLNENIVRYNLEDWAIVLFLKTYVEAAFTDVSDAGKVKILSALLTAQNINNAIGIRSSHRLLSLVSIDRKQMPHGINVFDEQGYKLIYGATNKIPFKIKNADIVFYKGRDIQLRAVPPKLNVSDYKQIIRSFYNCTTQKIDSLSFSYSPQYIKYSYAFPMAVSKVLYTKLPISPLFTSSFFTSLTPKLQGCSNKQDSINFLMRFTQTVIKYEPNENTYGWGGYPCYPENTLVMAKGDCDDYSMLLAFLLSYYFKDLDVVFLEYDSFNHVRLGIYDKSLDTKNKSFIEYQGKKYLLAELTGETVLGDMLFIGSKNRPDRIVQ